MDREIAPEIRRRTRLRRVLLGIPVVLVAWGLFVLLPAWLRPSIRRSSVLTARVERGTVEEVVEASGVALPAREKALSSPVDTRILRVLRRPGDAIRRGDALVELDTEATKLELDRLEDRVAQKKNEQLQVRQALERSLAGLEGEIEKAKLDDRLAQAHHQRDLRMSADGLISNEALEETEVAERKAAISLAQLEASVESARRATATQIEGLGLDLTILAKEAGEVRHRLDLATPRAEEDGILTWVASDEGASVRRGDILARIARLDSFRIEAKVADVHASRIAPGLPARALIDGKVLAGRVSSVFPKIEEGTVKFAIDLEDASNPALRQNLRLDVVVVTGARAGALRVKRGLLAQGDGRSREVFVVRGDEAVRTRVELGFFGRDYLEVTAGLAEGDEVIVSDMADYAHLRQVRLR